MHGAALVPAQVALEGIFVRVRGLVDGVDDVVEEHASAHRAVVALHLDPGGFFVRSESHPQTGLSRLPALQSPVHVLRHRHRLGGFPSWSVVMEAQRVEVVGVIWLEEIVLLAKLIGQYCRVALHFLLRRRYRVLFENYLIIDVLSTLK